ncbi:SelT/selW/selH selenoprotein domain containing protein [Ceratobasidium theobromae]|uniref:SelT/selW/selH selenoprotein domain containing protein n=1 Tax=Ceratobasidium theobromae TaxID=1582974 RepID=A0A5N5QPC5_9AGAM|nr:SelT/selW/selH selenoprotein domain containing protein [Ceratobasidium theobromae]
MECQVPLYHSPAQVTQPASAPTITIEFCDRCRWLHRATWVQTELFLTFPPPALTAITLMPLNSPDTGGRFCVWLTATQGQEPQLVWDRKAEGGFPELKVLKQRIRDVILPGTSLGHSDKKPSDKDA